MEEMKNILSFFHKPRTYDQFNQVIDQIPMCTNCLDQAHLYSS
jgi:hypothetical protein